MTTIRVTRRPVVHPEPAEGTRTRPVQALPERVDAGAVRLALIEPPAPRTTLDGAWWPRTSDLTEELPPLITELHRRGIRVTRAVYNPDSWAPAARRLQADGRIIQLGWFRHIDRQLLNMTGDATRGRLDLLVVPPDASEAAAEGAFSAATDRANRDEPTAVLDEVTAAGQQRPSPRSPVVPSDPDETAGWDSEGGHLAR
jgi:Family of unknown function (DUF5994)